MSLEDDDPGNLPELIPISSNQHVKNAIQNSTIITVDSSANVGLKAFIKQKATISSNIYQLINNACDRLTNLISILKQNVNDEQTSRGRSSNSCHEQSLVVKTRHEETRKINHHEVSSSKYSNVQMIMICPFIKYLGSTPIKAVCSHQQYQHIEMTIK